MTNEEAIKTLNWITEFDAILYSHSTPQYIEALYMAIEALKAQLTQTNAESNSNLIELNRVKSDLISRQALFDALHYWFASPGFTEDRWWNSTHVLAAIEGVPSAEPQRKPGRWIKVQKRGCVSYSKAYAECGQCHSVVYFGWKYEYCPNCGSPMEVEHE